MATAWPLHSATAVDTAFAVGPEELGETAGRGRAGVSRAAWKHNCVRQSQHTRKCSHMVRQHDGRNILKQAGAMHPTQANTTDVQQQCWTVLLWLLWSNGSHVVRQHDEQERHWTGTV